jgi:hypothetical protein
MKNKERGTERERKCEGKKSSSSEENSTEEEREKKV